MKPLFFVNLRLLLAWSCNGDPFRSMVWPVCTQIVGRKDATRWWWSNSLQAALLCPQDQEPLGIESETWRAKLALNQGEILEESYSLSANPEQLTCGSRWCHQVVKVAQWFRWFLPVNDVHLEFAPEISLRMDHKLFDTGFGGDEHRWTFAWNHLLANLMLIRVPAIWQKYPSCFTFPFESINIFESSTAFEALSQDLGHLADVGPSIDTLCGWWSMLKIAWGYLTYPLHEPFEIPWSIWKHVKF